MISTRTHGILDYTVGILLILLPWFLDLGKSAAETWTLAGAALVALLYSPLTDYEWGFLPIIPMRVHLGLDTLSGLFLIASPWLFGFADRVFVPHVVMGILEIGAVLATRRVSTPAATTINP